MPQAKYLDAAQDLRILQGSIERFATLENPRLGCEEFAMVINDGYRATALVKARQILDTEQDLQTTDEEDPVGVTLQYGKQAKAWLEKQQAKKEDVKHPMVTEDAPAKADPAKEDSEALKEGITEFCGKNLPEDPNLQLLMWSELSILQKKLKVIELELRNKMATHFVPNPKEGTNTVDLDKGWKVKVKHTLNRKADEAAFEAVFAELGEDYVKEDLFKFKPELIKSQYNKLNDKQKVIFDQCLIIKPGTPAIELVAPKEKK